MSVTQMKATAIAEAAIKSSGNAATDPTSTIAAVATILSSLVELYKACKKTPSEAAQHMQTLKRPIAGLFSRRRLWREVQNQQLPQNVSHNDVYDAIMDASSGVSISEVAALYRGD